MTDSQIKAFKQTKLVTMHLGKEYLVGVVHNSRKAILIKVTEHGYNFLLSNHTCLLKKHMYLTKRCKKENDLNRRHNHLEFRVNQDLKIVEFT